MKFHLKGQVKIYPTEDLEKVKTAVENIFSSINFRLEDAGDFQVLFFESETMDSLQKMKNILRQDQIRDSVRKFLNERI